MSSTNTLEKTIEIKLNTIEEAIEDIRQMRRRGMKLVKIAAKLSNQGVPTKTGKSSLWPHQSVAKILKRPM